MDKEAIKRIFEELLAEWDATEHTAIQEFSEDMDSELNEHEERKADYRKRFLEALGDAE